MAQRTWQTRWPNFSFDARAQGDNSEAVLPTSDIVNELTGSYVATSYTGDVTDAAFRSDVYADVKVRFGRVSICVPAAGITRDGWP